jgi:hypothetical protein
MTGCNEVVRKRLRHIHVNFAINRIKYTVETRTEKTGKHDIANLWVFRIYLGDTAFVNQISQVIFGYLRSLYPFPAPEGQFVILYKHQFCSMCRSPKTFQSFQGYSLF